MKILQSHSFAKKVKEFKKHEKQTLDNEIRKIIENPNIGQEKKSNLQGVFIHKFKISAKQYLLAYQFSNNIMQLIMIGLHENYYRDLKLYLKK